MGSEYIWLFSFPHYFADVHGPLCHKGGTACCPGNTGCAARGQKVNGVDAVGPGLLPPQGCVLLPKLSEMCVGSWGRREACRVQPESLIYGSGVCVAHARNRKTCSSTHAPPRARLLSLCGTWKGSYLGEETTGLHSVPDLSIFLREGLPAAFLLGKCPWRWPRRVHPGHQ